MHTIRGMLARPECETTLVFRSQAYLLHPQRGTCSHPLLCIKLAGVEYRRVEAGPVGAGLVIVTDSSVGGVTVVVRRVLAVQEL